MALTFDIKVGRLKPPPVLTSGFNRLKPSRSILPKVVNTGQSKKLVVVWFYSYISMNRLRGLKNNCFVINWCSVVV